MENSRPPFDARVTPARPDLAAAGLRGTVEAEAFVEPEAFRVIVPSLAMRRTRDATAALETELLFGERLDVYEIRDGWAWGQASRDGYVGYIPVEALARFERAPTHRVAALRTFLYPGPGIKTTPLGFLPFGAAVHVEAVAERFAKTDAGFVFADHLQTLDAPPEADPVAVAERFLGIPYLWGGKSSLGIDCSGLVQTACLACGIPAPRDSDMQEQALGERIAIPNEPAHYRRGDLLFWPGHVALCRGDGTMVHATAFSMSVMIEDIGPALERIAGQGHPLRTARRLPQARDPRET
jgi:cell wall-associated NlpC family hydrolase